MVYKRPNNRGYLETRPITAKVGVIPNSDGSAVFKIGRTVAYAVVHGPRDLYPRALQNPRRAVLRTHYNMMPFSSVGERVRQGPKRRSIEISLVTEKALLPVLELEAYPNTAIDVFIELSQADAGSRAAGICAASMALAHAGIEMKDLVSAIAVGKVANQLVVDLEYEEEAYEGEVADIPIAMIPSTKEISLLQMDGPVTKQELLELLRIATPVLERIANIERKALKAYYKNSND